MRIALVTNLYPPIQTGTAHWTRELAHRLATGGHEVVVITCGAVEDGNAPAERDWAVAVYRLSARRLGISRLFLGFDEFCLANTAANRRRMREIVRAHRIELLHQCVHAAAAMPFTTARGRESLVRIPRIGQTLWLSTTVVHGNQAELSLADTPAAAWGLRAPEQYAYKAHVASRFITEHPVRYLAMAAQRFVSFWMPGLYLDRSPRHRLLDLANTIPLFLTAAGASWSGGRRDACALLVGFALVLALESAFGQIDADARYRLPAEVLLLAPAAVTVSALFRRLWPVRTHTEIVV